MTTLDLTFLMLAAGALAGAGAAGLWAPRSPCRWSSRSCVSVAMLAVVRPVALRHLRTPAATRTGTAALVGPEAVVIERIDAHGGQVKLAGEVWSARSYDPHVRHRAGPQRRRRADRRRDRGRLRIGDREWSHIIALGHRRASLVLLVLVALAKTVRIIPQARAGVVERLGRYSRTLNPGLTDPGARSSTGSAR